mgnify:CR=1 FL=1
MAVSSILLKREKTVDFFTTERIDAIENGLVGGYLENGDYYIPSQIVDELIAIEKIKKSAFDSSIFCLSNIAGVGELVFELKLSEEDELKTVKLYLLETVFKINGYLQNTIRTEIARLETSDKNFVEMAFDKFNIKIKFEDVGREEVIDSERYFNGYIMARRQFCLTLKDIFKDKMLEVYGKYFNTRMLLLKKLNNEYTKNVIEHYNAECKKIEKYFYQYATNKNRNELLNKCFEDINGKTHLMNFEQEFKVEEEKITKQFAIDLEQVEIYGEKNAIDKLKRIDRDKINEMRTVEIDTKQVKTKEVNTEKQFIQEVNGNEILER